MLVYICILYYVLIESNKPTYQKFQIIQTKLNSKPNNTRKSKKYRGFSRVAKCVVESFLK